MKFFDVHLVTLGSVKITVGALVGCVILILVTWLVAEVLCRAIQKFVPEDRPRARGLMRRTTRMGAWAIGVLASLQTLGFDLGAVVATSAVITVGLGLALQKIAQSVLAGFVLLAEREIIPGDIVNFQDEIMRVERIGFRTTVMTTAFGRSMIVPNYQLAQAPLENLTQGEVTTKYAFPVSVDYGSDLDVVKKVLARSLEDVSTGVIASESKILLASFDDSGVQFRIIVATDEPFSFYILRSEVLFAAWDALRAEGIRIPFPQLDVHMKGEA